MTYYHISFGIWVVNTAKGNEMGKLPKTETHTTWISEFLFYSFIFKKKKVVFLNIFLIIYSEIQVRSKIQR